MSLKKMFRGLSIPSTGVIVSLCLFCGLAGAAEKSPNAKEGNKNTVASAVFTIKGFANGKVVVSDEKGDVRMVQDGTALNDKCYVDYPDIVCGKEMPATVSSPTPGKGIVSIESVKSVSECNEETKKALLAAEKLKDSTIANLNQEISDSEGVLKSTRGELTAIKGKYAEQQKLLVERDAEVGRLKSALVKYSSEKDGMLKHIDDIETEKKRISNKNLLTASMANDIFSVNVRSVNTKEFGAIKIATVGHDVIVEVEASYRGRVAALQNVAKQVMDGNQHLYFVLDQNALVLR